MSQSRDAVSKSQQNPEESWGDPTTRRANHHGAIWDHPPLPHQGEHPHHSSLHLIGEFFSPMIFFKLLWDNFRDYKIINSFPYVLPGMWHLSPPSGSAAGDLGGSLQDDLRRRWSQPSPSASGCSRDQVLSLSHLWNSQVVHIWFRALQMSL